MRKLAFVTVTTDGLTMQVPEGTLLDTARSMGINIPALCHDPDLETLVNILINPKFDNLMPSLRFRS